MDKLTVKANLDYISDSIENILESSVITNNEVNVNNTVLNSAQEEITNGLNTINSDHAAIHKGIGFCMHLYYASLAYNVKKVYRFKGPTYLYAHIKSIQVTAEGATISIKLIRNAVITNAGTEVANAIQNLNDNSIVTPQSKIYDSSVTYTGGTIWCQVIVHGDTTGVGVDANKSRGSGSFTQNDYLEYVTKSGNTDYILEIENIDIKNNPALGISINMFFYEEECGIV